MGLMNGWIKLHRKLHRSAVGDDPQLLHLWIFLLMEAAWEPRQLANGDWLEAGQLIFNVSDYAKRLGCHPGTVTRRLKRLVNLQNCATEAQRWGVKVTICNWATYQDENLERATEAQRKRNRCAIDPKKTVLVKEGKENSAPASARGGSGTAGGSSEGESVRHNGDAWALAEFKRRRGK